MIPLLATAAASGMQLRPPLEERHKVAIPVEFTPVQLQNWSDRLDAANKDPAPNFYTHVTHDSKTRKILFCAKESPECVKAFEEFLMDGSLDPQADSLLVLNVWYPCHYTDYRSANFQKSIILLDSLKALLDKTDISYSLYFPSSRNGAGMAAHLARELGVAKVVLVKSVADPEACPRSRRVTETLQTGPDECPPLGPIFEQHSFSFWGFAMVRENGLFGTSWNKRWINLHWDRLFVHSSEPNSYKSTMPSEIYDVTGCEVELINGTHGHEGCLHIKCRGDSITDKIDVLLGFDTADEASHWAALLFDASNFVSCPRIPSFRGFCSKVRKLCVDVKADVQVL
mmetsp:Transcript_9582/g.24020  ORF Transcript_9582/g.24020 Transcript_9582/m.24020 type:complete len:342 (+) Transcript_9582:134-1159(+)|eukprot:CAMPEP_0177669940 /NCGR_PEP_ID=MMETSP0447-20121125/23782_1 /TAXON_ID=0 /ORGANISM="Stygamoeba regulata, Strain BSH-02190019" /LENGTH=341 /DNA_ID=CAMNT_0019176987 /DNA_START=69 /DNA_END=1094 /DNA_ORIENTATION=+